MRNQLNVSASGRELTCTWKESVNSVCKNRALNSLKRNFPVLCLLRHFSFDAWHELEQLEGLCVLIFKECHGWEWRSHNSSCLDLIWDGRRKTSDANLNIPLKRKTVLHYTGDNEVKVEPIWHAQQIITNTMCTSIHTQKCWRIWVLTIYTNHPDGNFRHKYEMI